MKKNLLLTTLLLATTLTFTACGKVEESASVEESSVTIEETVTVEEETTEVEEESTEEEETLTMIEEEIRVFLENVRDMDYESYCIRHARYWTDTTDAEGNVEDDYTQENISFSVDAEGNVLTEYKHLTNDTTELADDSYATYYILADDTYASNDLNVTDSFNLTGFKEDIVIPWLECAPFFTLYELTDEDIDTIVSKAVVTEYNERPVLYIDNLLDDTEATFLEGIISNFEDIPEIKENSLSYSIYLYLDVPGDYLSIESATYVDSAGKICTIHDDYEMSKVNSVELPEIPENYIRY